MTVRKELVSEHNGQRHNSSWLTIHIIVGIQHYERGLMWAETYQSGHMQPEFQPRVAYRHLEWVLNHIQTL